MARNRRKATVIIRIKHPLRGVVTKETVPHLLKETGVDDFLGDFPLWASMIGICVIPFTIILPANITSILVLRRLIFTFSKITIG